MHDFLDVKTLKFSDLWFLFPGRPPPVQFRAWWSSSRPLSTLSPAWVSSAGTGLANAREQRRKQTRRVLIIFSGGQVDWGETAGSSFISRLCPQLPPWQASHLSQMIVMLTASWHRNLEILTNKLEKYFFLSEHLCDCACDKCHLSPLSCQLLNENIF